MVIEDKPNRVRRGYVHAPRNYALSGKIMLSAIVVLFTVVVLLLCLHIYVRCFLLRRRRRRRDLLRRHARVFFTSDLHQTAPAQTSGGLDIAILRSLPAFAFSSKTHPEPLECAVCLSDFDDGEMGRLLPSCNHCFHTDCIDMWFHSHSTCPLCRSAVKPDSSDRLPSAPESQTEVVVLAEERDGNSASLAEESDASSSSTSSSSSSSPIAPPSPSPSSFRKKPFGFAGMGIEVPKRNESFKGSDEELGVGSPLRSPGSGILALKRILSRERWSAGGSNCSSSSSSGSEIDLERGEEQSQHQR